MSVSEELMRAKTECIRSVRSTTQAKKSRRTLKQINSYGLLAWVPT